MNMYCFHVIIAATPAMRIPTSAAATLIPASAPLDRSLEELFGEALGVLVCELVDILGFKFVDLLGVWLVPELGSIRVVENASVRVEDTGTWRVLDPSLWLASFNVDEDTLELA